MTLRYLLPIALFAAAACGGPAEFEEPQLDEAGELEGEATATELTAKVDGFTVYVQKQLAAQVREGRQVFVLQGRTSKNLQGLNSFIFDDVYGQATQLSPRKFEVVFDGRYEANSMAAGIRVLVSLYSTSGDHVTAGFTFAPRLDGFSGSSKLFVSSVVKPVYAGGLVLRARVRSAGQPYVSTQDGGYTVSRRAGDEWNVDFTYDGFLEASDAPVARLGFAGNDDAGVLREKSALASLAVADFSITRGDAEARWPIPQCEAPVQACLDALPPGTSETESCGGYYPVTRCNLPDTLPQLGASPDDVSKLDAEVARINALLPSTKRVSYRAFYVQGFSSRAPSFATVLRAYLAQTSGGQSDEGIITTTQLNADLNAFAAKGLVPAAQQVVYQQSFQANRLRTGGLTEEVLYFPSAARLVVLQLSTTP